MTINDGYMALAEKLLGVLANSRITRIHLPPIEPDDEKKDEFGFIFLDDGSVGPFYVSLDDSLPELEQRLGASMPPRTRDLPTLLAEQKTLAERALAIGIFNALSAGLMRRAGFKPHRTQSDTAGHQPQAGETVGMVGYFCPLVDKLLARGCKVLVLERKPERVVPQENVSVSTDPAALKNCKTILCTAATLINNSLDELLSQATSAASFSLIGPTASGLPDVLFEHGVTSSGGVFFENRLALEEKLAQHASWGKAGEKFSLTPDNYPGIDALIARASA